MKPYIEATEETLRLFNLRTDQDGLRMIREGLFSLACSPDGLDDADTQARQAEEFLVTLPGATSSGRRSPEQRLRDHINTVREANRSKGREFEWMAAVLAVVEKELPDVVAAARERVSAEFEHPVGDTIAPDEPDRELAAGDTGSVDETAHTTPVINQPQAVAQP